MAEWVGIDLFAGAGGMSLGARSAGIVIDTAVELCPHASNTYALNFPKTKIVCGDVRNFQQWIPANDKKRNLILFGGPPCQGFSTSNQRTRNIDNARNYLVFTFVESVAKLLPDIFIMENVKGILEPTASFFLNTALDTFNNLGYDTSIHLLNAVDFRVPQNRSRVFIVGSRDRIKNLSFKKTKDKVSVWDAIHDLPSLSNGANFEFLDYATNPQSSFSKSMRGREKQVTGNIVTRNSATILARYQHITQGQNWESIPESLMANYKDRTKCHTGIYRRLELTKPSVVIGNYRKNMLIHPLENRGLSVREAARLQSIPDQFRFTGSIGFQQQQVGNMVPATLAHVVFNEVLNATN